MKAIGNFIFAGGFTLGVEKYFDVVAHLEDGSFGVLSAKQHWPELPIETKPERWREAAREALGRSRLDLLYCNPPCAAWSKAGKFVKHGAGAYAIETNEGYLNCTRRAADLAFDLEPRLWVWESVTQAWEFGQQFTMALAKRWLEHGYGVTLLFTDLCLHGVPQRRARLFFIAHQNPLTPALAELKPMPTPSFGELLNGLYQPGDPIANTGFLFNIIKQMRRAKAWGSVREFHDKHLSTGIKRVHNTGIEVNAGRPSFLIKRMRPDGYIGVISGGATQVHPFEDRLLSVRESQVLGGWPADFEFVGTPNQQYAQVGKAVQPAVAEYLARQLAETNFKKRLARPELTIIDHRPLTKSKPIVVQTVQVV